MSSAIGNSIDRNVNPTREATGTLRNSNRNGDMHA